MQDDAARVHAEFTHTTDECMRSADVAAPLNPAIVPCHIQAYVHTAAGALRRSELHA
jgi:hypothetical protein